MNAGGFSVLFEMGQDDGADSEKQIAIANLERFRGAADPDVALEALSALIRYCESKDSGGGEGSGY